ncbi:MAG: HypC/HybG/HupF family hydrogenase formation chaperone [Actinomycetota bacterium]
MCLGIPGQVIEIIEDQPYLARVDVSGVKRVVNIQVAEKEGTPVNPGDWVLIHVGFALSVIDEEEAKATIQFLEELGKAYTDELELLAESSIE